MLTKDSKGGDEEEAMMDTEIGFNNGDGALASAAGDGGYSRRNRSMKWGKAAQVGVPLTRGLDALVDSVSMGIALHDNYADEKHRMLE